MSVPWKHFMTRQLSAKIFSSDSKLVIIRSWGHMNYFSNWYIDLYIYSLKSNTSIFFLFFPFFFFIFFIFCCNGFFCLPGLEITWMIISHYSSGSILSISPHKIRCDIHAEVKIFYWTWCFDIISYWFPRKIKCVDVGFAVLLLKFRNHMTSTFYTLRDAVGQLNIFGLSLSSSPSPQWSYIKGSSLSFVKISFERGLTTL